MYEVRSGSVGVNCVAIGGVAEGVDDVVPHIHHTAWADGVELDTGVLYAGCHPRRRLWLM